MKILIIVPDGLSIRNYLYTSFISELQTSKNEIKIFHNLGQRSVNEITHVDKLILDSVKIPHFVESGFARLLREATTYARLLINCKKLQNKTIILFWNRNHKGFKKIVLYKLAEFLGFCLSKSYASILKLEKQYHIQISKSKILETIEGEFKDFNPDLVINLHQRTTISSLVILLAQKHSIATATTIFSWDNIPKARLISRYDHYFVWSDLMKTDLHLLYPEIKLSQIKVAGTPQFECYFNTKFRQSKEEFFSHHGLNLNKKTVCFSANDQSSPYEPIYFEDLCEEISNSDINNKIQILFRNCPVDKSNRFDSVIQKYKHLIVAIPPDWKTEDDGTVYPTYNDFYLLTNTVLHSDMVINLGSTMAHDFAVFNKPCLYLNYDPVQNSKFKVNDVYNFQHFRSNKGIDAVGWINAKNEFVSKIKNTLENPQIVGKDRADWMRKIVQHPLDLNSKSLANQIDMICTSVS